MGFAPESQLPERLQARKKGSARKNYTIYNFIMFERRENDKRRPQRRYERVSGFGNVRYGKAISIFIPPQPGYEQRLTAAT